eukprot:scaffold7755_cov104-Cylindrotheca_fusiformis.AAC.11
MAKEHAGFNVLSMNEYLETRGSYHLQLPSLDARCFAPLAPTHRVHLPPCSALTGKLRNRITGEVEFPPGNRTDWDGIDGAEYDILRGYLRNVSETATWNPGQCLPAFPSSGNHKDVETLQNLVAKARKRVPPGEAPIVEDPDPLGRLEDTLAGRSSLCVYNEYLQNLETIHFQCNHKMKLRMLVHFYVSASG